MTLEREADFEVGTVNAASITLRPDAIVPLLAKAPGPIAMGDISAGIMAKGWYVRPDNAAGKVLIAESTDIADGWEAETELFVFAGDPIVMLSLAFDSSGRPIVAMERAGRIWIRYHNGTGYVLEDLCAGLSPALVTRAPNTAWVEPGLFYEDGVNVMYRLGSEDYGTAYDTGHDLTANQHVWSAVLGAENRIHLVISTRDPGTGQYLLSHVSTDPYAVPCLDASGEFERIDEGIDTLLVFTDDGEFEITCDNPEAQPISIDVLLIGAGGYAGTYVGRSPDTTLWMSLGGLALDPNTDVAPSTHIAKGGGHGGDPDLDGYDGGCGGGGGARSPSNNNMFAAGGSGSQGNDGGGGRSRWGLLPTKAAGSGGGGGQGGHGGGGTIAPAAGGAGAGSYSSYFRSPLPGGGKGFQMKVIDANPAVSTGPIPGGGGAGGKQEVIGLTVQPHQRIKVTVGRATSSLPFGQGGDSSSGKWQGRSGGAVVLVRRIAAGTPADLSGGASTVDSGGYRYHIFTASGTIQVLSAGNVEALVVGGGGGGGKMGAGGGGADVRFGIIALAIDTAIVVGAGGLAGGLSGFTRGAPGGASKITGHGTALGGAPGDSYDTDASLFILGSGGGAALLADAGGQPGPTKGSPGGDGGGYNKAAGGYARWAGGGGGWFREGDDGATLETTGDELADDWDHASTVSIDTALEELDVPGATRSHGAIQKSILKNELFVVAEEWGTQGILDFHRIVARATYPTGPTAGYAGYGLGVRSATGTSHRLHISRDDVGLVETAGLAGGSNTKRTLEFYVADSLQQGYADGIRVQATDATYNGVPGSFGVMTNRVDGSPSMRCSWILACLSKNLIVGGVPTGGKAQVRNTAGDLIAEATEVAGTATVNCSRYGNGSTGAPEHPPLAGWRTLRVLDSGGATVAELTSDGIFPGAQLDVVSGALAFRVDGDGELIDGLLFMDTFDGLTPGPTLGDGGAGREIPAEWAAVLTTDNGRLAGGGGGGSEAAKAGTGGEGGGGDGGTVGLVGVSGSIAGAGGGGSGAEAANGGSGAAGIVVLRTVLPAPPPPTYPLAGLVVHHDAQAITGLSDLAVMTGWTDVDGGGYNLVAVGSPTYRDGTIQGINGYPAVRTGPSNYFAYAAAIMAGEAAGEVFVVLKNDNDPTTASISSGLWHFTASDWGTNYPWTNGTVYDGWGRAARVTVGNPTDSLALPHTYNVRSITGEWKAFVNGVQLGATVAVNTPQFLATAPLVGKSKDANYYAGLWGELFVWNRGLTTEERADVQAYVATKWGL